MELSADRSKRVGSGGMAGHAGPPVGPASDVVLPLHSLKKRGATWLEALEAMALAKGGWAGP